MLNAMLRLTVSHHAEKVALVCNQTSLTYRELFLHIDHFTRTLRACALHQGESVVIFLPNSPEFVISFFAVARIQALALPLNPSSKEQELVTAFSSVRIRAIITDRLRASLCLQAMAALPWEIPLIITDEQITSALPGSPSTDAQESQNPCPQEICEGDFLSQFSSGSTGRPKRIVRTQQQLAHEAALFARNTATLSSDTILCAVPMYHAHGLVHGLLNAVYTGAKLVLLDTVYVPGSLVELPFAARFPRVFEQITAEHVTILIGVPQTFSTFVDTLVVPEKSLTSLRLCFCAGVPLEKSIFERFLQKFGVAIRQTYGCTEAGTISTNMAEDIERTYNSMGIPLEEIQVRIVDDQFQDVPAGTVGEVVVKSPLLTSGYCNLPELNRQAFRDGYFLTGDFGKQDESNHLYLTGRKKLFIDAGGEKVDPLEVEDVLHAHSCIAEAVVVGCPSPFGGMVVKAVVVPARPCTEQELIQYCQSRLADFKVPRIVEFRAEIPKTPLGKILRKDLIDLPGHSPDEQALAFAGALLSFNECVLFLQSYLQQQLALLFQCSPQKISLQSSLGDLGLTSSNALALQYALEQTLHIPVPVTTFWSYSTLDALAAYLAECLTGPTPAEAPVPDLRQAPAEALLQDIAAMEALSDQEAKTLLETLLTEEQ